MSSVMISECALSSVFLKDAPRVMWKTHFFFRKDASTNYNLYLRPLSHFWERKMFTFSSHENFFVSALIVWENIFDM